MRTLLRGTLLLASIGAATPAAAVLVTVNSAADPGNGVCNAAECTLREALNSAIPDGEFSMLVHFAIPGAGPHTIALASPLPTIDRDIQVNGFTQPGAVQPDLNTGLGFMPAIEIDGSGIPDGGAVFGFRLAPLNFSIPTIKGLALTGFSRPAGDGVALLLEGGLINIGGNVVESNFIGLSADGITVAGNDIGIRANSEEDVTISNNVISGNRVGVLGNGHGTFRGMGLFGNRIGTDPAGNAAMPNSEDGVRIVSACVAPAQTFDINGNVISGNGRDGIHLAGASAECNSLADDLASITGNRIGIARNGTALGNGRHGIGVGLRAGVDSLRIGTPMNSNFPEDENLIGHNGGAGVAVFAGASGVLIRQNTFIANAGLPIDLGADGTTPNDPGDADTGANSLLNTPDLGSARRVNGQTVVPFRMSSDAVHARYPMRVDFYAVSGDTQVFVDTAFAEAPGAQASISLPVSESDQIVAMASDDMDGDFEGRASNSSEFSAAARPVLFADGFE